MMCVRFEMCSRRRTSAYISDEDLPIKYCILAQPRKLLFLTRTDERVFALLDIERFRPDPYLCTDHLGVIECMRRQRGL
jgi:hypothetical protein